MIIENAIIIAIITALTQIALYVFGRRKESAGIAAVDAQTIRDYNQTIAALRAELAAVDAARRKDSRAFDLELAQIRAEAEAVAKQAEERIAALVADYETRIAALVADYETRIADLRSELTERLKGLEVENYNLLRENNQLRGKQHGT